MRQRRIHLCQLQPTTKSDKLSVPNDGMSCGCLVLRHRSTGLTVSTRHADERGAALRREGVPLGLWEIKVSRDDAALHRRCTPRRVFTDECTPHRVHPGMTLLVHATTRENVIMQRRWAGERNGGCRGGQRCLLLSLTTTLPEEIGATRRRLLTMV